MKVKYITLVNLLADEEIYPEFATTRDRSNEMADQVLRWLNDPAARSACVDRLRQIKEQVARPGACERAAHFLLERLGNSTRAAA
jgi:lipid-A-disaccharide synthase